MRVEFCQFLGHQNKQGTISLKPIGRAKNSIKKPQLSGWQDVVTEIVVNKRCAKGLDGITDYSHVIILYWLNEERECHLKHHPQGRADVPYVGIFACRCSQRPNPIGISTVRLLGRKGNLLKVKGLDILDGTPVLDIKPYTPAYDAVAKIKIPTWVNKLVF